MSDGPVLSVSVKNASGIDLRIKLIASTSANSRG